MEGETLDVLMCDSRNKSDMSDSNDSSNSSTDSLVPSEADAPISKILAFVAKKEIADEDVEPGVVFGKQFVRVEGQKVQDHINNHHP